MTTRTNKIRKKEQDKVKDIVDLIIENEVFDIVDNYYFDSKNLEIIFSVILNGKDIEVYKNKVENTVDIMEEIVYSSRVWFYLLNELDVIDNYFK